MNLAGTTVGNTLRSMAVLVKISTRFAMAERTTGLETVQILENLVKILKEENVFDTPGDQALIRFVHPQELQESLQVTLGEEASTLEEVEKAVRCIARYSVKTSSPHFHNQLYGGMDAYGLAGAWLSEALNTSQYTFEVAPVFTLLEREILDQALGLVGYPKLPESDGILCPGGSISNMYGLVLARYKIMPDVKTKGLCGQKRLAIFSSECAHYSVLKGAHWLGFGTESVFNVKTDSLGRMETSDLRRAIEESRSRDFVPFFVNATSGTTVFGAFDPIDEIAAICQEEKLWLHVDACLGGSLLLSNKYRDRLKGIELSNSVAWNPHKMLGSPLQCSLFLVRAKNLMHEANCANATYLFQQDKFYDVSFDTGDKSVQCGRKVDSAKLWLMWKARGTRGLGNSVDVAMDCAEYFYQRIKKHQDFRLVLPTFEANNICFWYIPPSLRDRDENEEWWKKLYSTTSKIKERLVLEGSLMIGYSPMSPKKLGNFFRMVVCCQPPPTHEHMDYVIAKIEQTGAEL